jgi:hypothetical protein
MNIVYVHESPCYVLFAHWCTTGCTRDVESTELGPLWLLQTLYLFKS